MLATITVIISVVSFMCFGIWARPYNSNYYSGANRLAYYAGPIHLVLSPVIYVLVLVQVNFQYNWFTIISCLVILANVAYYVWAFRKFEGTILNIIFEVNAKTGLSVIIIPHAALVLTLGFLVLPA